MFSSSPTPQRQPVVSNRPSLQEALAQARAAAQATMSAPAYDPAKNGVVNPAATSAVTPTAASAAPRAMLYGGQNGKSYSRGGRFLGGGNGGEQLYTPTYTADQWQQMYGTAPTSQNWR